MKFSLSKFASVLFITALVAVGCNKDYEADIDQLNQKIDNLSKGSGDGTIPGLETQIAALQALVENYNTQLKAALDANQTDQNNKYNELLGKYNDVKAALDAAKAQLDQNTIDLAAYNAKVDGILSDIQGLDTELSNLAARVTKLEDLESRVDALEAFKAAWEGKLDSMSKDIDNAKAAITRIDNTIAGIQKYLNEDLKTWQNATEESIKAVQALCADLQASKVDKEVYDAFVAEVKATYATKEELNTLQALFDAFAETYAQDLKDLKAEDARLDNLIKALTEKESEDVKKLAEEYKAADAALEARIVTLEGQVKTIEESLAKAIEDIVSLKADVAKLQADMEQAQKDIVAANETIANAVADLNAHIDQIDGIAADVAEILARTQSIVFIPQYNDGLASIEFAQIGGQYISENTVLRYEVRPVGNAKEIAAAYKAGTMKAEYLLAGVGTRAGVTGVIESLDIVEMVNDGNVLAVTVSANGLTQDFFTDDDKRFAAALYLSDRNDTVDPESGEEVKDKNFEEYTTAYTAFAKGKNKVIAYEGHYFKVTLDEEGNEVVGDIAADVIEKPYTFTDKVAIPDGQPIFTINGEGKYTIKMLQDMGYDLTLTYVTSHKVTNPGDNDAAPAAIAELFSIDETGAIRMVGMNGDKGLVARQAAVGYRVLVTITPSLKYGETVVWTKTDWFRFKCGKEKVALKYNAAADAIVWKLANDKEADRYEAAPGHEYTRATIALTADAGNLDALKEKGIVTIADLSADAACTKKAETVVAAGNIDFTAASPVIPTISFNKFVDSEIEYTFDVGGYTDVTATITLPMIDRNRNPKAVELPAKTVVIRETTKEAGKYTWEEDVMSSFKDFYTKDVMDGDKLVSVKIVAEADYADFFKANCGVYRLSQEFKNCGDSTGDKQYSHLKTSVASADLKAGNVVVSWYAKSYISDELNVTQKVNYSLPKYDFIANPYSVVAVDATNGTYRTTVKPLYSRVDPIDYADPKPEDGTKANEMKVYSVYKVELDNAFFVANLNKKPSEDGYIVAPGTDGVDTSWKILTKAGDGGKAPHVAAGRIEITDSRYLSYKGIGVVDGDENYVVVKGSLSVTDNDGAATKYDYEETSFDTDYTDFRVYGVDPFQKEMTVSNLTVTVDGLGVYTNNLLETCSLKDIRGYYVMLDGAPKIGNNNLDGYANTINAFDAYGIEKVGNPSFKHEFVNPDNHDENDDEAAILLNSKVSINAVTGQIQFTYNAQQLLTKKFCVKVVATLSTPWQDITSKPFFVTYQPK